MDTQIEKEIKRRNKREREEIIKKIDSSYNCNISPRSSLSPLLTFLLSPQVRGESRNRMSTHGSGSGSGSSVEESKKDGKKETVVITEERSAASDIFQELDRDKDGKITREELRDGLRILRLPYSDEVINGLLEKLDVDKNGEISFHTNSPPLPLLSRTSPHLTSPYP